MFPIRKTFVTVRLIATGDNYVKMKYVPTDNKTDLNQLLFDDDFLVGFNSLDLYLANKSQISTKWILKNSSTSGTHAYMSSATSLKELITKFNAANVKLKDCLFIHGINYSDTVTFSGDRIICPSYKDYSSGYKSRGIDRWKNGFELTRKGLYECPLIHTKDMASYIY